LASASRLAVWDLEKGCEIGALQAPTSVQIDPANLTLSNEGHCVLFGSSLRRWTLDQDHAVDMCVEEVGTILAVTPDGRRALARMDSRRLGVWDIPGRSQLLRLEHEGDVSCAAITPDGTRAISGDNEHDLRVWDLTAAGRTSSASGIDQLQFVAFAEPSKYVVFRTPDGYYRLWDMELSALIDDSPVAMAIIRTVLSNVDRLAALQNRVAAEVKELLAVTDDRPVVVRGSGDGGMPSVGPLQQVRVATDAQGKRAVSATQYLAKHGDFEEPTRPGPEDRVEEVTLWDLGDSPPRRALKGHSTPVRSLDITSNGQWAITGCWGRIVRVWDLDEGVERWALRGHGGIVSSVAISDDGRFGVSASEDGTARLWNLETGSPIATFTGEGWMSECWIAPEGDAVVAQERSGRIHILKLFGTGSGRGSARNGDDVEL
jgi:WD40 repeat protein